METTANRSAARIRFVRDELARMEARPTRIIVVGDRPILVYGSLSDEFKRRLVRLALNKHPAGCAVQRGE